MQNQASGVLARACRFIRRGYGIVQCRPQQFLQHQQAFDIPASWPGPHGALLLLAQLLAQFLPFLWCQRHFCLACLGGLALGLQGLAQLGPALLALGRHVIRPGGLGDRLRQNRTRKAKEASKSEKNLHSYKLTRWRGTLFTLLNGHSCKLSKFL
jgi:hypothetical protein